MINRFFLIHDDIYHLNVIEDKQTRKKWNVSILKPLEMKYIYQKLNYIFIRLKTDIQES